MISFRDITDLEPIDSIPDNADIVVVVDGVAKRISKENAKFGGGAVEKKVFYVGADWTAVNSANAENGLAVLETAYNTLYKDAELTTFATAQEVFDAWKEGSLMIFDPNGGYIKWQSFYWESETNKFGDETQVRYIHIYAYGGSLRIGTSQKS